MKYHLITTKAKIKHKNKIFLGYWCSEIKKKLSNNKVISSRFILGRDAEEREKIERKIINFEAKLYPKLHKILDNYHNTTKSKKYYSYIIGKWLRRYLAIMLNRYLTLDKFLKYNKSKIKDINLEAYKKLTPPLNSLTAIKYFDDDKVNDWIYFQALKFINLDSNIKFKIKYKKNLNFKKRVKIKKNLFDKIYKKFNLLMQKFFSKFDKNFFISTYMPLYKEAIINLYFFQIPKIWTKIEVNYTAKSDLYLRKKLKNLLISYFPKEQNKELKFIIANLFNLLPSSYLENFVNVKRSVSKSYWPKNPNLIFTSNSFDTDEGFKYYLAEQKEKNPFLKYIVGQHGMGYNFKKATISFQEREIADNVFVWGKYTENKNQIPGFILKSSKINYNKEGKILIICTHLGFREQYWDKDYFFTKNFNRKILFLNSFKNKFLNNNIILRLGTRINEFNFNEEKKIKNKFPKLKIDLNNNIYKSYASSRLVIHFYLATTFLETVSQNIPSIMLMDKKEFNYSNKGMSIFKMLKKNNILFDDSKKLHSFIEKNYNNLEKWWCSKKIQSSLNIFRRDYCRNGKLRHIADIIKNI